MNPVSPEALASGCICPMLDNSHGKGWFGVAGVFWIAPDCPLHGIDAEKIPQEKERENGFTL